VDWYHNAMMKAPDHPGVWVAGIDGCKLGWFRASRNPVTGDCVFVVFPDIATAIGATPFAEIVAVDIPIGLPDAKERACDREARKLLRKPRSNSVFPAIIRPALKAGSRREASEIGMRTDERKVSAQAWALAPKIREVDEFVRTERAALDRTFEVHPELSFWCWAGGSPMSASKKTVEGKRERLHLVEGWLGAGVLPRARGGHLKKHVADDDILDACAALWTATRISEGQAQRIPAHPQADTQGLDMAMWF
jgi:predicted RNase H-like nuclease